MGLEEYNKKRSFNSTPEPAGESVSESVNARQSKNNDAPAPLHFVVQKHHASHLHYDFRLEMDGVLKSWAVPKGPSLDPSVKRLAMMVEDHPLSYIKFEGTIPKGNYGAGDVIVWDYGLYQNINAGNADKDKDAPKYALHKGALKFVLYGEKLKGTFSLAKIGKDENSWILTKVKDGYSLPESEEKVTEKTESVLSGKRLPIDNETVTDESRQARDESVSTVKVQPMPRDIKPMLATLTDKAFDNKEWIYEIKWDGYRAIAEVENKRVRVYSRNGNSFNQKYSTITEALKNVYDQVIFDGEIVAMDESGKSSFHALQFYREKKVPLTYVIFDILYLNGEDLREKPLKARKLILKDVLNRYQNVPNILYSDHVEEKGVAFCKQAAQLGLEGIIAKDKNSIYRSGARSASWLKIKNDAQQEAVIVGFTEPRGERKKFGSLVLAVYEGNRLKYIGHSGGGFTSEGLKSIHEKLLPLVIENSPLKEKVPINSPITWVKPQLVCEIKFSEWTKDGRMRHPIFIGLREDKRAQEVVHEKPGISQQIKHKEEKGEEKSVRNTAKPSFTNTKKIFWPEEGYTKGDVISYYDNIANIILPYLKDRPQSLHRHPNGIHGKSFFQKNIETEVPSFVEIEKIWSESNEAFINYLICSNKETLLYLANLGCIELNPWNSRVTNLENPDFMILDLDPGNIKFKELVKVAKETRTTLTMSCQQSFIKTSGKRGLHIVVPLGAKYNYDQIKNFAHLVAVVVNKKLPSITSVERSPSKRKNKIYLDYLQNRRGQTLAAPYSLRPAPGATVSTPLHWDEVTAKLDPKKFTIKTIFKRIEKEGDLWKPVITESVDLNESIRCLEEYLKSGGHIQIPAT